MVGIPDQRSECQISAYPNPFTTSTAIEFTIYSKSNMQFAVYNSIGEVVYQFADLFDQGTLKVIWSPALLPAGLYYGVLRSEEGVSVVKMVKE